MIRSAVTISLVPEARGGPFVFWGDLAEGINQAAEIGFDGVEVFAPGPETFQDGQLRQLLDTHRLALAAVGTGAGWVKHKLTLIDNDPDRRAQAIDFVRSMIAAAAMFGAPVIIGSMQGRWGEATDRGTAIDRLRDALAELGFYAAQHGQPIIYEPLNRYETNMACALAEGEKLIRDIAFAVFNGVASGNVRLLADLFHMNIEEANLADALRASGAYLGHVHFVDSNRHAAGFGHTDFGPIADALRDIGYGGFVSAEALPLPDPRAAAERTMQTFRRHFPR